LGCETGEHNSYIKDMHGMEGLWTLRASILGDRCKASSKRWNMGSSRPFVPIVLASPKIYQFSQPRP